jgi:phenylacetate-coenzyme A ligase PaaK-like adenylate-forming protein
LTGDQELPPQLIGFLHHAAVHSPHYASTAWAKRMVAGNATRFSEIAVTLKKTVLANPSAFISRFNPPDFGKPVLKHTSGSTGHALAVYKAEGHFRVNAMENTRLLAGWNIEKIPVRVTYMEPDDDHSSGTIETAEATNGTIDHLVFTRSADKIAKVVLETKAQFLAARPSQIEAMLDSGNDFSNLQLVKTSTEAVSDQLFAQIKLLPHCKIVDLYGSVETGLIAASCPRCGLYHLADRNVLVEVLRDDDVPAQASELGRVVATVFSNPAMPLVRYDLGDMVRYTTSSLCQPGRMSFTRIYGRERMMFVLPNGERILPALSASEVLALGIKRFKMVQTNASQIELRYMGFEAGLKLDAVAVQNMIDRELSPQFFATAVEVTEFPLAPSGKYLMHERLIS